MSDTDSFIDEVTEEVRRDRLFLMMRRYGWIAVALVVLLVGAAAYNEWRKAQTQEAAQALGDAVIAALETEEAAGRTAALQGLAPEGDAAALAGMLGAMDLLSEDATRADGIVALQALGQNMVLAPQYRQLATLKAVLAMGPETPVSEREALLAPLAVPGQPYALLAQEQQAVLALERGDTDAAVTLLRAIAQSTEATAGLRQRVGQLMVVLGADPADAS